MIEDDKPAFYSAEFLFSEDSVSQWKAVELPGIDTDENITDLRWFTYDLLLARSDKGNIARSTDSGESFDLLASSHWVQVWLRDNLWRFAVWAWSWEMIRLSSGQMCPVPRRNRLKLLGRFVFPYLAKLLR